MQAGDCPCALCWILLTGLYVCGHGVTYMWICEYRTQCELLSKVFPYIYSKCYFLFSFFFFFFTVTCMSVLHSFRVNGRLSQHNILQPWPCVHSTSDAYYNLFLKILHHSIYIYLNAFLFLTRRVERISLYLDEINGM